MSCADIGRGQAIPVGEQDGTMGMYLGRDSGNFMLHAMQVVSCGFMTDDAMGYLIAISLTGKTQIMNLMWCLSMI
jgi:hypothetical protein